MGDLVTFPQRGKEPPVFTHDEQRSLLRVARDAIARELGLGTDELPMPGGGPLAVPAAAFVTLHRGGELRGCVGYIEPVAPLFETVREVAVRAAFHDPRFPPLAAGEFSDVIIEISVLSALRRIAGEHEVVIGRHGLVLELRGARGLLLPQVAVEQGWGPIRFLEYAGLKAGLSPSAWKDPEASVSVFSAEVFAESSLEGARP
jgi:AmmeMemoRadiSam system protein A